MPCSKLFGGGHSKMACSDDNNPSSIHPRRSRFAELMGVQGLTAFVCGVEDAWEWVTWKALDKRDDDDGSFPDLPFLVFDGSALKHHLWHGHNWTFGADLAPFATSVRSYFQNLKRTVKPLVLFDGAREPIKMDTNKRRQTQLISHVSKRLQGYPNPANPASTTHFLPSS